MATRQATVQNSHGIHCRPSALIMNEVRGYGGVVQVVAEGRGEADLRSMLDLLSLGLQCGESISITVSGPDEEGIVDRLVTLFETHFDFPSLGDADASQANGESGVSQR